MKLKKILIFYPVYTLTLSRESLENEHSLSNRMMLQTTVLRSATVDPEHFLQFRQTIADDSRIGYLIWC